MWLLPPAVVKTAASIESSVCNLVRTLPLKPASPAPLFERVVLKTAQTRNSFSLFQWRSGNRQGRTSGQKPRAPFSRLSSRFPEGSLGSFWSNVWKHTEFSIKRWRQASDCPESRNHQTAYETDIHPKLFAPRKQRILVGRGEPEGMGKVQPPCV